MATRFIIGTLLSLATVAVGQTSARRLPCDYSGDLLRTREGKVVWYTSGELKKRATNKVEVDGAWREWDISVTVFVELLISPSGKVECIKTLEGHPLVRADVERALRLWTFQRADVDGKPIAYLGFLEFVLCNLGCGPRGPSMTLLK
jgi:hypothetical protein